MINSSGDDQGRDHFDALETVSNQFTYGNFLWTLRLRPQPLLIPNDVVQTAVLEFIQDWNFR